MADGVKKINENIMKDGRIIGITTPGYSALKVEPGTLFVNPGDGSFKYVNASSGTKEWRNFDPAIIFNDQTIITRLIKDKNITTDKINDYAITTIKYANESISTEKYRRESVTTSVLAPSCVNRTKIAKGEIVEDLIASEAVTTAKIKNRAVTRDKIGLEEIINGHIQPASLERTVLKPKTLTSNEIGDGQIIESLIGAKAVTGSKIGDLAVSEEKILNLSVTHNKLGEASVYGSKIKAGSIETNHIGSINGSKIVNGSIENIKLANNSVRTVNILNDNVTFAKLDPETRSIINDAIRVKPSQVIAGQTATNTAYCKGSLTVRADTGTTKLKVYGDIEATGNITGAKVYNPVFADVAEGYIPTERLEAGDPVALCEEGGLKVEKLTKLNVDRFLGVVSNEYACVFGATSKELEEGTKVAIALIGRIRIKKEYIHGGKIGERLVLSKNEKPFISTKDPSAFAAGKIIDIKDDYMLCQVWPV